MTLLGNEGAGGEAMGPPLMKLCPTCPSAERHEKCPGDVVVGSW